MSRTEAAANLWGLRRDPPSPAARLIAALGTSTAALSQLPDLLLGVGLQLARRNWKQNENKNGETNTGKEGVRRPRAKVETGWRFLWGWFVVKWAGSFSNLEKRELGAKCLILPFLLGWPCSFLESLLWWLTYLCAYLPHQDAFKSEELHLLPRQEALMTHVLDEEDLWWAEGPQALYFNGKLNKLKDTPTHPCLHDFKGYLKSQHRSQHLFSTVLWFKACLHPAGEYWGKEPWATYSQSWMLYNY